VFQVLDSMVISADSKQLAEATYMKKKMYYNMRIKTLKRNTTNVVRKALEAMQGRTSHINLTLNVLLRQRKDIQRELEEQDWLPPMPPGQSTEVDLAAAAVSAVSAVSVSDAGGVAESAVGDASGGAGGAGGAGGGGTFRRQLLRKLDCLNHGVLVKSAEIETTKSIFERCKSNICSISEENIARLIVELETGGNIRLEDGRKSDVWYSSCVDLLGSRFFTHDFNEYGVADIKVNRVSRIHNRFLRNRFEQRLSDLVERGEADAPTVGHGSSSGGATGNDRDSSSSSTTAPSSQPRRTLEYLFFGDVRTERSICSVCGARKQMLQRNAEKLHLT
jgi:hypothetical protein